MSGPSAPVKSARLRVAVFRWRIRAASTWPLFGLVCTSAPRSDQVFAEGRSDCCWSPSRKRASSRTRSSCLMFRGRRRAEAWPTRGRLPRAHAKISAAVRPPAPTSDKTATDDFNCRPVRPSAAVRPTTCLLAGCGAASTAADRQFPFGGAGAGAQGAASVLLPDARACSPMFRPAHVPSRFLAPHFKLFRRRSGPPPLRRA